MAGNTSEKNENNVEQAATDPWAMAFAALDQEDKGDSEAAPDTGDGGSDATDLPSAAGADLGADSDDAEGDDGLESPAMPGGPGDLGGEPDEEDAHFDWDGIDISEEGVNSYRDRLMEDIRERTIRDVAKAYIDKGARNNNGQLGATINDPDVCKRDSDGVPRFYNPETGREFTGDNPRRQAQEWVDDYNRELSEAFNKTCQGYSQRLLEQEGTKLAVIEFASTYKNLDPVRRSMLDSIIEDYEVTDDDGDVIGYSCDLNKALAAVNRQVRVIQSRFSKQQAKPAASGPALDTPSVGAAGGNVTKPQFKSIEEAMEWEQDQLLAKMKGKR